MADRLLRMVHRIN
uniref:Uncharacterized protein n=1 Tax=Rhizophora mucronata TaxID=61149 RepID=A0A2P2PYP4_RHIMU